MKTKWNSAPFVEGVGIRRKVALNALDTLNGDPEKERRIKGNQKLIWLITK